MTAYPSVRKPALDTPEPIELEFARDRSGGARRGVCVFQCSLSGDICHICVNTKHELPRDGAASIQLNQSDRFFAVRAARAL
jgi:hypothetical protein